MNENISFEDIKLSLKELIESQKDTDRKFQETDRKIKELSEEHKKTELAQQKTELAQQKTELAQQKTELAQQKTDEQIKELGRQIGGVHKSFGNFTEDLLFNSLQLQMQKQFGTDFFDTHLERQIKGDDIELDAVAFSNGTSNQCFVIEVKSKFTKDAFKQLEKNISRIGDFYSEFKNMKKYGVIAVPHLKPSQLNDILKNGFYPATMKGDILIIENPEGFKPKSW